MATKAQTTRRRPKPAEIDSVTDRLAQLLDDDVGIARNVARYLYLAFTDRLTTRDRGNDESVQMAALRRRGAVVFGTASGERITISDECAYSFDVSE